jgi:hypothetical protein
MANLEEFHQDFLQSILSNAGSRGLMKPQAFFENVCEELILTGDLTKNYTNANHSKIGMEVHGFDYDDERRILSLLVHQFFQTDNIETLTKQHIDTKFKRLESFYAKSIDGLYTQMEETSEAYDMAYQIYQWHEEQKIDRIKLIVFTDGKATRNLLELPNKNFGGIEIEFRVIDINYLYRIYLSENSGGAFEVKTNLPYLIVNSNSDEYISYLSCISGDELAKIYDKFGQRLFEQNVRTFLQFRGKVNKGLRNTIEYAPTMFFAYNNGITATATNVEMKNNKITKIHNLQIVNGGQTTSAIYAAKKNFNQDVSQVSVQIKLSVVKDIKNQDAFVSKVSEYANTQNKINKSDFFSNSPFHKDFKNHSKIFAPTSDGSQRRTHWFYERVRGEYLNEQAYLSASEKRQFKLENPKAQVLDKTFLSKSENTWLQKPNVVSKGAQYSFKEFADKVTKDLEKDDFSITEKYFKDAICRVILFKNVEKMISKSTWYDGGFRAQTVTYSIAYLSHFISKKNKFLDFNKIWEMQGLPQILVLALETITQEIYQAITNPPAGHANISNYCKKDFCWEVFIKKLDIDFSLEGLLLDEADEKYSKKTAKKEKKLDTDIEIQTFVINLGNEKWIKLLEYYKKDTDISPMQSGILNKYCSGTWVLPSPKQAKMLYKLHNQALDDGVIL